MDVRSFPLIFCSPCFNERTLIIFAKAFLIKVCYVSFAREMVSLPFFFFFLHFKFFNQSIGKNVFHYSNFPCET